MQDGRIALGPLVRALAQKSYMEFGVEKDKLRNNNNYFF